MTEEKKYKELLDKVEKVSKEKKLDVNVEEDLSVGIMNLIGIEEHLFFTAEKTGKPEYFNLLNEVRAMRVELLKKIIKEYEGEVWCCSKHLLAASMRMIEVGTKELKEGNQKEAESFFEKAYNLYNLFWALNLKAIDTKMLKDKGIISMELIKKIKAQEHLFDSDMKNMKENLKNMDDNSLLDKKLDAKEDKSFFAKLGDLVKKAIDCCKE